MKNPACHRRNGPYERIFGGLTELSYSTLLTVWFGMAFCFGLAYFGLSFIEGQGPSLRDGMAMEHRFWNSLYFSIITATSTGYGDIIPHGISKALAASQSVSALIVFAIFISKLVSHKQEVALMEVHRLTFEDVFHNTREGLYICRKDFDHILAEIETKKSLSPESWKNMKTAYEQIQALLMEIPDFYENEAHCTTIDVKREQLLIEAIHRTMHRINQMLDAASLAGIDWVSHEESMRELQEVIRIVEVVTPKWRESSPYSNTEAFEDILLVKDSVHERIKKSLPLV